MYLDRLFKLMAENKVYGGMLWASAAVAGDGFVPANTQLGVWLCQTSVCPAICILLLTPKFTKASAGSKS